MSTFPTLLNSVDDSKAGDHSANSKSNITEQLERKILAKEGSKDLRNNAVPTLYSGSPWTPSIPTAQSDLHDAFPDHKDGPVVGLDYTMANLEAVEAQDVNSSAHYYTGNQTSQTTPNVQPWIAPPSSDRVSKTPSKYAPQSSASSAASPEVGRHVDASTRIPSAQSTRTIKKMKPSLTNNDTSSPSSSFQASQNGSKQVNKSQGAKISANDQSVPSTFEGNMSGWPQREGFPRDQPGTVAQPLASTTNLNSSHKGDYHGHESNHQEYDSSHWHTTAAMPTSMPDNNYSSRPKAKIDHQASSGSYQENGNSPWEAPSKTATAHFRSSTSRQQTSDSVKSTPLLGSPVESRTTSPSSHPLAGSPSSAVGGSNTGKIPKSQTSQVPSSGRKPEGKLNPAPVIPGIIADSNDNMSSLTTLDTTHPCQIVITSEKSKAQSTPQVGCHNSSTGSYSGKQRSADNLYNPAALQQKSKHPSVYTPYGDLDQDKPLAMNGGKLNSWKDGNKDTTVKSKPAKGTFWTYDGADSRLSSNSSSSISATSKKSSSSRTEISQNLSYPTSAEVHGNKHPPILDSASRKDMNSTNLASGGVDKTHPSHGNLSSTKGRRPMLGDDVSVNSNSSTYIATHHASSSSSSSGRTDTFSESRGDSRGRLVQTSQYKSTKNEQTSNEWRSSVQNSSSGLAAQPPLKDPNGTHARPWHPMSVSTQNATQPRLTSQNVESESASSKNSSSYSESFNSTSTSSISGGQEERKPTEKGNSSSWLKQALLPGASPSPETGYQVSTGGKITAISVGLGFSVGVLVLVLLGGLMKRRVLRKNRPAGMQISNPTSQSVEDVESIFSSHLGGSMQGDGHHSPSPLFDPGYRASTGRESGVDPFRTSYPFNGAGFQNRYDSYASSFGSVGREDFYPGHYPGPPSHPQETLRADKRRSDGISLIPITFHHNQPEQGAGGFRTEDYERQDALPHSAVPWNPDHQNNDDCGTEVATRFSDGETMIEDGSAPHFSPDQAPPVPPLHFQHAI